MSNPFLKLLKIVWNTIVNITLRLFLVVLLLISSYICILLPVGFWPSHFAIEIVVLNVFIYYHHWLAISQ